MLEENLNKEIINKLDKFEKIIENLEGEVEILKKSNQEKEEYINNYIKKNQENTEE